jgi:hypothetical protein
MRGQFPDNYSSTAILDMFFGMNLVVVEQGEAPFLRLSL